jgi:hypothetical protein
MHVKDQPNGVDCIHLAQSEDYCERGNESQKFLDRLNDYQFDVCVLSYNYTLYMNLISFNLL